MKVNKSLNSIISYNEKNPEIMQKFNHEVREFQKQIAESLGNQMQANTYKAESSYVPENSKEFLRYIFDAISPLMKNEKVSKLLEELSSKKFTSLGIAEQNKAVFNLKVVARKFLRQNPIVNENVKNVAIALQDPRAQKKLEIFGDLLSSCAPSNFKGSVSDAYLDTLEYVPPAIKKDYIELTKDQDTILNKPITELYSEVLFSLVRKK